MFPRIIEQRYEERIDHAEVLSSVAEMLEGVRDLKFRAQIIGYITKQLSDIELAHAQTQGRLMARILEIYRTGSQRRYDSRAFLRFLSLGTSGKKDADSASGGALQEVKQLITTMEKMNQKRIENAVLARLPLLRFLAGTSQEGNQLAMRMLQAYLPDQYRRIIASQNRPEHEQQQQQQSINT